MKQSLKLTGLAVLLGVAGGPAVAQEKIKVGTIVTLSGPAAVQLLRERRPGALFNDIFAAHLSAVPGRQLVGGQ